MAVSELPGNPNAVWTVKRRVDGELSCHEVSAMFKPLFIHKIAKVGNEELC
jgi:splicing factor 3B subunit 3